MKTTLTKEFDDEFEYANYTQEQRKMENDSTTLSALLYHLRNDIKYTNVNSEFAKAMNIDDEGALSTIAGRMYTYIHKLQERMEDFS